MKRIVSVLLLLSAVGCVEDDHPLAVIPAAAIPDPSVERYRVPIEGQPTRGGGKKAKVTIVEFSDFECPYCARGEATIDKLLDRYGKTVRIVWRNYPVPTHQHAEDAAEVALAADNAGKFWAMQEKLLQHQDALGHDDLVKYAKEIGLTDASISEALEQHKYESKIRTDQELADKLGLRATPTFYINGRPLSGAKPIAQFDKIIREEIKNAERAIDAGVPRSQVYDALTRNARTDGVAVSSVP